MRRLLHFCQLAVLGMLLATCTYGQSHQSPRPTPTPIAADSDDDKLSEIPTRKLTFTASDPVGGLNSSTGIILPMHCTSDGLLFLDILQSGEPPSLPQQVLIALTPQSSRSFAVTAIHDLHGTSMINYFPGSGHVAMLVRATRETNPLPGEAQVRQSTYRYFVAFFSRQGEYQKSVELQMHGVSPSHIAELASGEFLITGYDRANDLPRLYLVADDGQVIRTLVLPYAIDQYVPSDDPNSVQGRMNASTVVSYILMAAHGDEVLVWRRGGSGPILRVGAHGSTREINLDVPKGLTLADVLSSDKLWVAHFQPAGHAPDQPQDNYKTSYYQFDPSDGSLSAKLVISGDTPEHAPPLIACEEQGTFLSFQTDDKGQTRILSAR